LSTLKLAAAKILRHSSDYCAQLVDEAWHRWQAEDAANADDVTAVVVAFTHSA